MTAVNAYRCVIRPPMAASMRASLIPISWTGQLDRALAELPEGAGLRRRGAQSRGHEHGPGTIAWRTVVSITRW